MSRWLQILIWMCVVVGVQLAEAKAAYREPKGIYTLFPRGLVKRIAMPGKLEGFMFKTFREPIFVAGKERSHFSIITNGVDHRTWSYEVILSALLRNYCGISDGKFAGRLIKKTYQSKAIGRTKKLGRKAGVKRFLRQIAVASGCKVTIEIDGARWHKITATFEPAK